MVDPRAIAQAQTDLALHKLEVANGNGGPFSVFRAAALAQAACDPPDAPCGFGGCPRCDETTGEQNGA